MFVMKMENTSPSQLLSFNQLRPNPSRELKQYSRVRLENGTEWSIGLGVSPF